MAKTEKRKNSVRFKDMSKGSTGFLEGGENKDISVKRAINTHACGE
jgi:hypothetical protein